MLTHIKKDHSSLNDDEAIVVAEDKCIPNNKFLPVGPCFQG